MKSWSWCKIKIWSKCLRLVYGDIQVQPSRKRYVQQKKQHLFYSRIKPLWAIVPNQPVVLSFFSFLDWTPLRAFDDNRYLSRKSTCFSEGWKHLRASRAGSDAGKEGQSGKSSNQISERRSHPPGFRSMRETGREETITIRNTAATDRIIQKSNWCCCCRRRLGKSQQASNRQADKDL